MPDPMQPRASAKKVSGCEFYQPAVSHWTGSKTYRDLRVIHELDRQDTRGDAIRAARAWLLRNMTADAAKEE